MCLPYSGTACPIETNTTKPELPKICWNWAMISGRPGTQQGQSRKTYGFNHFLWASMGAPENDIYHQKKSVLVRNMMRNQLNKWQLRPSCFQTYQLRYLKPIKSHEFVLVEYLNLANKHVFHSWKTCFGLGVVIPLTACSEHSMWFRLGWVCSCVFGHKWWHCLK